MGQVKQKIGEQHDGPSQKSTLEEIRPMRGGQLKVLLKDVAPTCLGDASEGSQAQVCSCQVPKAHR